jgi:hypothetical protein
MRRRVLVLALYMVAACEGAPGPVAEEGNTMLTPAGDTRCTGVIGAIDVDNVVVPAGATCTLNGTRVKGNIKVEPRARRLTANRVTVGGSIQADGAGAVRVLQGSVVEGDVQVKKGTGTGDSGAWVVRQTTIGGDAQFEENGGRRSPGIENSIVDGDIQVFKQRGGGDPILVRENRVGENLQYFLNRRAGNISLNNIRQALQCKENTPPPTGGGNTAGEKEGQCAGL